MMQPFPFLLAFAFLGACASQPAKQAATTDFNGSLTQNVGTAAGTAYSQTREGLTDAALSPLEDLNLRRDEIPPVLADADSPYDLPANMTCPEITALLGQLNRVLGPDWDTPNPDERLRTEKLADSASNAALNAIASEARGMIPFRSLVRKATGAESHEKRYNQAYKIGAQQRTYLKGMGLAKGCDLPARPDFNTRRAEPAPAVAYNGDAPYVVPDGNYQSYEANQLQVITDPDYVDPAPVPAAPSETTLSPPTQSEVESEALQSVPHEY